MIYSTSRPTLLFTQSNSDLKQSRYWLALKICYAQTHKPFHYYIDQDRISVIEFGKKLKIPDHLPFVSVISGTLTSQVIKNLNKLSDKEDLNKRKIEELEKAKIEAQEELKLATKKQKDAEDEKVKVILDNIERLYIILDNIGYYRSMLIYSYQSVSNTFKKYSLILTNIT